MMYPAKIPTFGLSVDQTYNLRSPRVERHIEQTPTVPTVNPAMPTSEPSWVYRLEALDPMGQRDSQDPAAQALETRQRLNKLI